MPIVGARSRFGIEYELAGNHGGASRLFGRICFWCGGTQIGDYNHEIPLNDVLTESAQWVRDNGRRGNPRFSGRPAEEVFHLLNAALFGPEVPKEAAVAEDEQWAAHLVLPRVEPFNGWRAALVDDAGVARLVVRQPGLSGLSEWKFERGELDRNLRDICRPASGSR